MVKVTFFDFGPAKFEPRKNVPLFKKISTLSLPLHFSEILKQNKN